MAEVYSSTVGDRTALDPLSGDDSSSSSSSSSMSFDLSRDLLAELINEGAFLLENGHHSVAISVLTSALNVAMRDAGCPEFMLSKTQQQDGDEKEEEDDDDDAAAACGDEESSVVSRGSRHHSQRHNNKHSRKNQAKHSQRQKRTKLRRYFSQSSMARCIKNNKQQPAVTEDKLPSNTRTNYLYLKPLRIADRYSLPCFVELTLYVVYNLALANQLRVISKRRRKGNTKTYLEIARLYKLAQTIQSRSEIGLEPTYTVSLWNNLGQAYKSLGKDNQADICFHNMLANVVCMIDHGCVHEVDHLDDFLDNIAHILTPEKLHADAA